MDILQYQPGDPQVVDKIVNEFLSQGKFDQLRKECMSDVDTKPAYQNLQQRVESAVVNFLKKKKWTPDLPKNQLRDQLRKHIMESGFLETGINRIIDQVVNPKILATVFLPEVEEVVYNYLGVPKPVKVKEENFQQEQQQNKPYPPSLLDIKLDHMPLGLNSKKQPTTEITLPSCDSTGPSNSTVKKELNGSPLTPEQTCSSQVADEVKREETSQDVKMDVETDESNFGALAIDEDDSDLDNNDMIMSNMSPISVHESSPEPDPNMRIETFDPASMRMLSSDLDDLNKKKIEASDSDDSSKKKILEKSEFTQKSTSSDSEDALKKKIENKNAGILKKTEDHKSMSSDSDSTSKKKEDSSTKKTENERNDRKEHRSDHKKSSSSSHSKDRLDKKDDSKNKDRKGDSRSRRSRSKDRQRKDKDRKTDDKSKSNHDSKRHSSKSENKNDKNDRKEKSERRDDKRDDRKDKKEDKSEKKEKSEDKIERKKEDEKKDKKKKTVDDHSKERSKRDDRRSNDRDSRERDRGTSSSSSNKTHGDSKRRDHKSDRRDESRDKKKSGKDEKKESDRSSKDGRKESERSSRSSRDSKDSRKYRRDSKAEKVKEDDARDIKCIVINKSEFDINDDCVKDTLLVLTEIVSVMDDICSTVTRQCTAESTADKSADNNKLSTPEMLNLMSFFKEHDIENSDHLEPTSCANQIQCNVKNIKQNLQLYNEDKEEEERKKLISILEDKENLVEPTTEIDKLKKELTEKTKDCDKTEIKDFSTLCKSGLYQPVIFTDKRSESSSNFCYFSEVDAEMIEREQEFKDYVLSLKEDDIFEDEISEDEDYSVEFEDFNKHVLNCLARGESNFNGGLVFDPKTEQFFTKVKKEELLMTVETEVVDVSSKENSYQESIECLKSELTFKRNNFKVTKPFTSRNTPNDIQPISAKKRKLQDENSKSNDEHFVKSTDPPGKTTEETAMKLEPKKARLRIQQKYNSCDLYKPRLSFSSSSRRRYQVTE